MGESTKIQWAHHTFNPWRGCTKIAPGCANCYADAQSKRNPKTLGIWGPNGTRVVASEAMWRQPLKWNREAGSAGDHPTDIGRSAKSWRVSAKTGIRPRVFCASLADVFEDWAWPVFDSQGRRLHVAPSGKWCPDGLGSPVADDGWSVLSLACVRARLFRLIDATPHLDWLLLTKRPENVRRMWPGVTIERDDSFSPPKDRAFAKCRANAWLGKSIACQEDADRNVPEMLKCRDLCAKTFLSIEPLIGPVDLSRWLRCECRADDWSCDACTFGPPDWVIVGGESGPNARPCNIAWIRSIVRQCCDAGVPCFVKQLGARVFGSENERHEMCGICIDRRPGTDAIVRWKLRDSKGGDPSEWPEDVRVREVPISTPAYGRPRKART